MNRRRLFAVLFAAFPFAAGAGAWGEGSFDNDDALDWVNDCVRSKRATVVLIALKAATSREYVEAPTASAAIAAAEVVAAAKSRPSVKFPAEIQAWLNGQSKEEIAAFAPVAIQALDRILSPKGSELHNLWKDSKSFSVWESQVRGLIGRVR